ncbi:MAG: carboxypeptidase-like regulatory domain-containing protein [Bacteroides sp.]|nr:carboxypeptidase-like regulatory domain-containing protein [Bacteroides sp.]
MKRLFLLVSLFFFILPMQAQRAATMLSGRVISTENNEVMDFATVYLKDTHYGCVTNEEGLYHLKAPAGKYTLVVSAIGYKTVEMSVELIEGQRMKQNVTMRPETVQVGEVVVVGGGVSRVNKSAFNAVAIDTKKLSNTTLDLAHALDNVSGVKIRQEGGVGSSAQINLNGFTGKHVKVFMDGVPMEGAGSAFQINNIPAGLADRIEVYKGVVPIDFGGDALGGAINIVTGKDSKTYVDASYSFGSFNTHKSNVSFGLTSKKGFVFQLNAYQNYSDNDYKVKTQYTDLATNVISNDEHWFRRFHDRYHNEAVIARIGVVNKPWADRFMLGFTYSHEYAQIQNANLMKIVFGGKLRKTEGLTPTLNYEKRNLFTKNLDFSLTARYDMVTTQNIDTASRTYSWTGEYVEKDTQGEGVATLAEYKGKTAYAVANLRYHIGNHHYFALNNMYSNYIRKTTNSAANAVQSTAATYMRRTNEKDVLGLSYKYVPGERWNVMAFAKYYYSHVRGPVDVSDSSSRSEYEEQARNSDAFGYGAAGSYFLLKDLQTKLSYEKTYRMPTDRELFGDGDYEYGDASIRPEYSNNVNLNFNYMHAFRHGHSLSVDLGFNYRHIGDYIIRTIGSKGTAISSNHGKVLGLGADLTAHYYYKNKFTIGGNFSYQDMRDKEHYTALGATSVTYNNRVPNLPYLFGNADASYNFHNVLGRGNVLTISYNFQYVHKFFRSWEGEGAKLYIPEQISHDASIAYSLKNGRYNISAEARNFTDALLYDNYSLQKPGRSFAVKFRYFFMK